MKNLSIVQDAVATMLLATETIAALTAERDALRAHMMTLMDVAQEGVSLLGRTYDYEPRCRSAIDKARALLEAK